LRLREAGASFISTILGIDSDAIPGPPTTMPSSVSGSKEQLELPGKRAWFFGELLVAVLAYTRNLGNETGSVTILFARRSRPGTMP